MKAVILAAGAGKRLARMGWDKPKCLLPCPGGTLLDNTLEALGDRDISDVVIVVGYKRELVEQAAKRHTIRCQFVVNPDYATTNTIYSLWLTREHLPGGFVYFNSDVWFDREVLDRLLPGEHGRSAEDVSALAVAIAPVASEDVKVIVDDERRILRIGKELPCEQSFGEFVGIARFAPTACGCLVEALRNRCEKLGEKGLFFEAALDDTLSRHRYLATPIGDLRAIEIDTPEDYAAAKSLWQG
jgi:choline kinase